MGTSAEIKQKAIALAEKTNVNSITPKEVGGIMYDLASHSENVLRNGGTLGIRKVYESVAAMEADSTNPKDFWGDPIKKGNLVVIYDGTTTGVDNNKIYAFMKPGWVLATKLDAAYATKAEMDAKLSELDILMNEIYVDGSEGETITLLDMPYTQGVYLNDKGETITLSFPTSKLWRTTDYIEVSTAYTITDVVLYHNGLVSPIAFYDENKVLVKAVKTSGSNGAEVTFDSVEIPSNAKYMRVSYQENGDMSILYSDNSLVLSKPATDGGFVWDKDISAIKNEILDIKEYVGYNVDDVVEKTIILEHNITAYSTGPSYNSDGTRKIYDGWAVSEPLELPSGTKRIFGTVTGYSVGSVILPGLVFLDSDKNYIGGIIPTTSGNAYFEAYQIDITDIPKGSKYVVLQAGVSASNYSIDSINVSVTYQSRSTTLIDRVEVLEENCRNLNKVLSGLKLLCLGDSITNGDYGSEPEGTANDHDENYPYFLSKKFGCEVVNEGRNGGTAISCWNGVIKNVALDNIDAVVIMFGANGSITNTLATDVEPYVGYENYALTQCGAMCKIIEYIYEKKPNISIFVCTPPQAGIKRQAYRDRIIASQEGVKSIAKRYHIPLIDVYNEAGVSDWTQDVLQPIDNLHFGAVGYSRLGTFIGSKILSNLSLDISSE